MCRLAGHFNGTDPTVPVAELKQLWVPGIRIVYIGKTNHGGSRKGGLLKHSTSSLDLAPANRSAT